MYDKAWAKIGWIFFFIGFNALYLPMFWLGMKGMPRRYYDYLPEFHAANILSTLGSWVMTFGVLIIIFNLFRSAKNGPKAEMNPWNGKTLEWTVTSPPPVENFEQIPVYGKDDNPYKY